MSSEHLQNKQTWRIERIHKDRKNAPKRGRFRDELVSIYLGPEPKRYDHFPLGTQSSRRHAEPFLVFPRCNFAPNLANSLRRLKCLAVLANEGGVLSPTPDTTSLLVQTCTEIEPGANIDHIVGVNCAELSLCKLNGPRYLVAAETLIFSDNTEQVLVRS